MRYPALALACLLATGCQVIVLGDSNTCGTSAGCGAGGGWVDLLTLPTGWSAENHGVPGLQAADAMPQLDAILAAHSCGAPVPAQLRMKLVIALGTNDLVHHGWTGENVGPAVLALYDRARKAPCFDVYVATIPPRLTTPDSIRTLANAMIQLRVPAGRLIPFGDETLSDLGASGVHVTADGQRNRADMAQRVLFGR